MEARHVFYFCVFMLLLTWKGCVNSLKCYVCNDCNEIREEYIETCDTMITTVEPENNTVSTTETGNDQTTTVYDETTTESIQVENTDVTTVVPTIVTQTSSETTISTVAETTEVTEPITSTQSPEIDDNNVFSHYRAEMNKTSIINDDKVIINNDFDAPSQIYVDSLNPRCILTTYMGNDSNNEITVRGCSFESDDDEARCAETIGLFGVELRSCMLCDRDLCNAAYFASLYHFAIITSIILNFVN